MPTPIEILMQAARVDKTPRTGTVSSVTPPTPVPTVAPMAQVQPQLSPTAQYVQNMQALMQGGIGKLSSGEKLGALGQILQAAGSRGAADPSAVIQNVRNQQMQKLNAQYQIAQLQQKAQEEQRQRAAIEQYKVALEPDQINALEGLPLEEQAKKVADIAFRQDQVQQIKRGDDGKTYILFASGKTKEAGFSLPKDFEKIDTGNGFKFVNKDNPTEFLKDATGRDVFIPQEMSLYQRESLGLQRARLAEDRRTGGGGEGKTPSYQFREVAGGDIVAFDPKNPTRQIRTGQKAPTKNMFGFDLGLPPAGGKPLIRR